MGRKFERSPRLENASLSSKNSLSQDGSSLKNHEQFLPIKCKIHIGQPLEPLFDHYHIGTLMEKNIDMLMYAALTYLNGKRERHIPKVLFIVSSLFSSYSSCPCAPKDDKEKMFINFFFFLLLSPRR